jgi:hypothetical protein
MEDDMFRKVPVAKKTHELSVDQLASVSGGAMDGISRLIMVTQMKGNNANDGHQLGTEKPLKL